MMEAESTKDPQVPASPSPDGDRIKWHAAPRAEVPLQPRSSATLGQTRGLRLPNVSSSA